MVFLFFAAGIAAIFFLASLIALHCGRALGLRYRKQEGASDSMAGLGTVEGAIFGIMGLLLAFTISGALQRFDDRRQLVLQEATAVTSAYDRLGLLEGQAARELQSQLKDYVRARVELYRMQHDFLLWQRIEDFSREQQNQLVNHKDQLWKAAVAACPKSAYQPACGLVLPALNSAFEVARCELVRRKSIRRISSMRCSSAWVSVFSPRRLWHVREPRKKLDTHALVCGYPDHCALHSHRHGISAPRPHPDRKF